MYTAFLQKLHLQKYPVLENWHFGFSANSCKVKQMEIHGYVHIFWQCENILSITRQYKYHSPIVETSIVEKSKKSIFTKRAVFIISMQFTDFILQFWFKLTTFRNFQQYSILTIYFDSRPSTLTKYRPFWLMTGHFD